ncbi:hypothetical protein [Caudoviricetes sp.]|nr:hypothetical protein [Caudoviricetes sp.]
MKREPPIAGWLRSVLSLGEHTTYSSCIYHLKALILCQCYLRSVRNT